MSLSSSKSLPIFNNKLILVFNSILENIFNINEIKIETKIYEDQLFFYHNLNCKYIHKYIIQDLIITIAPYYNTSYLDISYLIEIINSIEFKQPILNFIKDYNLIGASIIDIDICNFESNVEIQLLAFRNKKRLGKPFTYEIQKE